MKPHVQGLLQPIECFVKETNMLWVGAVNEVRRLENYDAFVQLTVHERIGDIYLIKSPSLRDSHCEDNANRYRFNNWTKVAL